jgi:hypothetical protein
MAYRDNQAVSKVQVTSFPMRNNSFAAATEIQIEQDEISFQRQVKVELISVSKRASMEVNLIFSLTTLAIDFVPTKCLNCEKVECH